MGISRISLGEITTAPVYGIHGAGELRYGGADTTRSSAGKLEVGNGQFALHTDANAREFYDLKIPGYAKTSRERVSDDADASKHRLANSDGRQDGGEVGGSYTWDDGYAGVFTARTEGLRLSDRFRIYWRASAMVCGFE